MADNNKLELVVEVDVNKANASIKSVNTGLSSMEQAASKAAHGASAGIDGMTAGMVNGAAAGNLIAESIKKALEWAGRRSAAVKLLNLLEGNRPKAAFWPKSGFIRIR